MTPTKVIDTEPTTLATCEHCGADAEYHSDLILCADCESPRSVRGEHITLEGDQISTDHAIVEHVEQSTEQEA